MPFVLDLLSRNHLEAFKESLGLAPAVRLDDADYDIDPVAPPALRRKQHLVSFAYPWRSTEKNLQTATALLLCRGEQCLG